MKNPLPSGPSSLCFNKEEFMKDDFNVESFVVECRRRVPLENLRDDLSVYLKILQSAMIELINKDYADFVNLSTNLVGMDKAINNLMSPLNQLKSEVSNVRTAMVEAMSAIEEKTQHKAEIRDRKACLQRLINIIHCVDKMESLLGISHGKGSQVVMATDSENVETRELSGQLIERVATEFNKLQFFVNKSRGLPLVEEIRPRVMVITTTLQYSLEGSFKEGLETGDTDVLRQCLRTYATIDKMRDAESLFRQHIVKPGLEPIINEQAIKNGSQGLGKMYDSVLEFIPRHCKQLREVTAGKGQGGGEVVRGYDFLVNSVWPEIVTAIDNRAHSIFAPGNPTVFHDRYIQSIDFIERFERQCGSQASVRRLRSHPSYNTFMTKWSLPVYFQIRFQEIAGDFETSLLTPFNTAADKTLFHQHATFRLWRCLHQCWETGVYLAPLSHRFWKLTLQLLTRYTSWLNEIYTTEVTGAEAQPSPPEETPTPRHPAGPEGEAPEGEEVETPNLHQPLTLTEIVCLISDVQMLTVMLGDFFTETVQGRMTDLGVTDTAFLEESINESVQMISAMVPKFGQFIVRDITEQCSGPLKTVSDIPRLYRRTNREVPSLPSSYVNNVIKPIQIFLTEHSSYIGEDSHKEWMTAILQNITETYLTTTSNVLTSVRKMEESLTRLKKPKKSSAATQGVSDDDKIRLQLFLDVSELGTQIDALDLERENIPSFIKLYKLVHAAKSGSAT